MTIPRGLLFFLLVLLSKFRRFASSPCTGGSCGRKSGARVRTGWILRDEDGHAESTTAGRSTGKSRKEKRSRQLASGHRISVFFGQGSSKSSSTQEQKRLDRLGVL